MAETNIPQKEIAVWVDLLNFLARKRTRDGAHRPNAPAGAPVLYTGSMHAWIRYPHDRVAAAFKAVARLVVRATRGVSFV